MSKPKEGEVEHLTLEETAVALKCTTQTVWRLWEKGALKAHKLRNLETKKVRRKMFRLIDVQRLQLIQKMKKPEMLSRLLASENFIRDLGYMRKGGAWVKKPSIESKPRKKANKKSG